MTHSINSKHCRKGLCIAGRIKGQLVKEKDYGAAYARLQADIEHFNTTRRAVPHPGFAERAKFCAHCGRAIPVFVQEEE